MRHVVGVLLAAATALIMFFAAGWGVARITTLHSGGAGLAGAGGLAALAAVLLTGVLVGVLLVVPWISPLGAGLPGALLLGWSILLFASARQATRLVPLQGHACATGFASMLVTGVLAFAGAVMIIPLFVPSRWQPRGRADFVDLDEPPREFGLIR
jgi:hypothetical protein